MCIREFTVHCKRKGTNRREILLPEIHTGCEHTGEHSIKSILLLYCLGQHSSTLQLLFRITAPQSRIQPHPENWTLQLSRRHWMTQRYKPMSPSTWQSIIHLSICSLVPYAPFEERQKEEKTKRTSTYLGLSFPAFISETIHEHKQIQSY